MPKNKKGEAKNSKGEKERKKEKRKKEVTCANCLQDLYRFSILFYSFLSK